ncbi:conserved Plasmodium protein, unknown function [Plasmodium reichenowi]|uniref:KELT protein n=2 Tax=Plasmodium reichenowi TaxID=5854 RepID=A0A060S634_PLARE|nr:conserved Plasmodium protein, unknown function [Plasmodium reichenowi]
MAYLKKLFLILFCIHVPKKANKYVKNISLAEKQQKEETSPSEEQPAYNLIDLLEELDILSLSNKDEVEKQRKKGAQETRLLGNIDLGYGKLGEGIYYEKLQEELRNSLFCDEQPGYGHIGYEELSDDKRVYENIEHNLLKTIEDDEEMLKGTERKDNVDILRTPVRGEYDMWSTSGLGSYELYDRSRLGRSELLGLPLWGNYDLFGGGQAKYEEEKELMGAVGGRYVDEELLGAVGGRNVHEEVLGAVGGRNVHEEVLGAVGGRNVDEEVLGAVGGRNVDEEVLGAVGGRNVGEYKETHKDVKHKYSQYRGDSHKGKYEEKRGNIHIIPRLRTWRSRFRGEGHSTEDVIYISDSSKGAIPKQHRSVKYNKKDQEDIPEDLGEEYEEDDEEEEEQKKKAQKNRDLGKKNIYKFEESLSYIVNDKSIYISNDDIDEFRNIIITSKDINQIFDFSLIESYLGLGISTKEDVEKMNIKYPLYRGEKVNFKNLRNPFRIEHPYLKEMESLYVSEMLFFDDYLSMDMFSFLSEQVVGNLTLQKILKIFKHERIKYLYFSDDALKYVNFNFPDFNLYKYVNLYKKNYVDRDEKDICDFSNEEFPLIKENNKRIRAILLDLKRRSLIRNITKGEKHLLKSIVFEEKKTFSLIRKILSNFTLITNKIRRDYSNILFNISSNGTLLPKDGYLLQAAYYILNYCLFIVKPFYGKIEKKEPYNYNEIARLSGTVNSLINVLEFIEHNNALYNDLLDRCKCLQSFYPRVESEEGLVRFYRYAIAKIEIMALVYDIHVILTKMNKCEMLVKEYERYNFPSYQRLLVNTEILLNDAESILFENN